MKPFTATECFAKYGLSRSLLMLLALACFASTGQAQRLDTPGQTVASFHAVTELTTQLLAQETPETCQARRVDIARFAELWPQDLELILLKERCEALLEPKPELASTSATAAEALIGRMLRDGRGRDPGMPAAFLRVTTPFALAIAFGMTPYSLSVLPSMSGTYIIATGMRDPETGEERWVYGEILSSLNAIPESRAQGAAMSNLLELRATFSQKPTLGEEISPLLWLLSNPATGDGAAARAVFFASSDSLFLPLPTMLACFSKRLPDCEEDSVDQLLALSEQGFGLGNIGLAVAHALGAGVKTDAQRAIALLDKATDSLGAEAGATQAALWIWTVRLLAEEEPKAAEQFVLVLSARSDFAREMLSDGPPPEMDRPMAQFFASRRARDKNDETAELKYLRRSAKLGFAPAMAQLGTAWQRGQLGLKIDLERAEDWFQRAADLGDRSAAVKLAELIQDREPDGAKRAVNLLSGTVQLTAGRFGLAALVELVSSGGPGFEAAPEKAAMSLEQLAKRASPPVVEEARFLLARMRLNGEGVPLDTKTAEREMRSLVKNASPDRLYRIALALDESELKVPQAKQIRKLLERAAKGEHAPAMDMLGIYWSQGYGGRNSDAQALEWYERAISAGYTGSRNNAAWLRCTSPDARLRKPAEAKTWIAAMKASDAPDALPAAWQSTIAACAAANGDFDDAIQWQERAVAKEGNAYDNEARLKLYRANQPYIETPKS